MAVKDCCIISLYGNELIIKKENLASFKEHCSNAKFVANLEDKVSEDKTLVEQISAVLDMSYEFQEYEYRRGILYVYDVEGDWKHIHGYLDGIVKNVLGDAVTVLNETDIEEDGSDYYTSTHRYRIPKGNQRTK